MSHGSIAPAFECGVEMKHSDIVSGLFWLVIGLGLSIWTLSSYKIGSLTQPGEGYLSLVLGILLTLFSLILLIGQIKKRPGAKRAVLTAASFIGLKKIVYTFLIMIAAAIFFERLGYLLTFFFMMVLLFKASGPQSWTRILIMTVLTTAGVYVLFILLLEVQLPHGILGV